MRVRVLLLLLLVPVLSCHKKRDRIVVATGGSVSGVLEWVVQSNPSAGTDAFFGGIVVDGGFLYVTGSDGVPGNFEWRVEKRSAATGALDAAFGAGGVLEINPTGATDGPVSIAVDATFIYLAGCENRPATPVWRIEKRTKATGALDPGFGTGGVITTAPSTTEIQMPVIAIDASFLYVAGEDNAPGDTQWRIEKRNLMTGALDTGFDADGIVTVNPSAGTDRITAIVLDATAVIVAGQDSSAGDMGWRIERRSLATGALDGAFGTGGVVTNNPSAGDDLVTTLAIDGASFFVGGEDLPSGNHRWRLEKRALASGALDAGFGTAGILTADYSSGSDQLMQVVVDGAVIYLGGIDQSTGGFQWRVERRLAATGALDTGFAVDGAVVSNPSAGFDVVYHVAVDGASVYLSGEDSVPGNRQLRIEKRAK